MLVWLGHGASDGTDAWLACYDTPRQIQGNGIVPQTVADQIVQDWHRREPNETAWALVIVEACGAGTFVSRLDVLAAQKVQLRRIAMVGVSGDSAGYVGELRKALKRTRDTYGNNDEHVLLIDFVSKLDEFLGDVALVVYRNVGRHSFRLMRLVSANLSAPVDVYREWVSFLAELSPDERNHFVPKAHGAGHGEFAWHFVGRAAERQRIATWLRARPCGMLVVTGSPGCGKSALLGNLVVLANPALRDLLVRTGRLAPPDPDELPPDHAFDAVVHLAGLSTSDLVRRLADAAGVTLPSPEHVWSEEDMDHLAAGLAGRRFTVLADALDEARDPVAIAGTVLSRIAQLPGGRVIVGTRTAIAGDTASGSEPLLNALDGAHPTDVIRVSHDPVAIETYVRQRLLDARRTQRIDADDNVIDAVAERLGAHGDQGRPAVLVRPARCSRTDRAARTPGPGQQPRTWPPSWTVTTAACSRSRSAGSPRPPGRPGRCSKRSPSHRDVACHAARASGLRWPPPWREAGSVNATSRTYWPRPDRTSCSTRSTGSACTGWPTRPSVSFSSPTPTRRATQAPRYPKPGESDDERS